MTQLDFCSSNYHEVINGCCLGLPSVWPFITQKHEVNSQPQSAEPRCLCPVRPPLGSALGSRASICSYRHLKGLSSEVELRFLSGRSAAPPFPGVMMFSSSEARIERLSSAIFTGHLLGANQPLGSHGILTRP